MKKYYLFHGDTQTVEHYIKLISEASDALCKENVRIGFIKAALLKRNKMPTFETKKKKKCFYTYNYITRNLVVFR